MILDSVKVKDEPTLIRDPNSKAIKSVDNDGLIAYRKYKNSIRNAKRMESRLNSIENDLDDVRNILQIILEKLEQK